MTFWSKIDRYSEFSESHGSHAHKVVPSLRAHTHTHIKVIDLIHKFSYFDITKTIFIAQLQRLDELT